MEVFDFLVIGAGVTGSWTAYELSKYDVKVCLAEKGEDVCSGASRANSAIVHAGYDAAEGTLMAKLNVRGNELIRRCYKKMSIPFRQIGSLVLAFGDEELEAIQKLYLRGKANGVPNLELLTEQEVKAVEPYVSEKVVGALYAPTAGVVSAFELAIAPADVAVKNGAVFVPDFDVISAEKKDGVFTVKSADGRKMRAKHVINAAGVHADDIAALFGDTSFRITPRRGEYAILDNRVGYLANHVLFQPPVKYGKGILVSPTVDGNILVGPTADNIEEKDDKATTADGLSRAFKGAKKTVPTVNERDTITVFAGVRPIGDKHDFILGFSDAEPCLINAAGIESPGLTSAPAVAEYLVALIKKRVKLKRKESFDGTRNVVRMKELTEAAQKEIIKKDPRYGRIICRCETISEGEIAAAIHSPIPARSLDAVKRRVRAGMGRCQGGFCSPRVMEIIARELGVPETEVTKSGGGSWLVDGRVGTEVEK